MEPLIQELNQLRLYGMASRWQALVETREHHRLSLSEGLEVLLQAEAQERTQRRFERLEKNARFRYKATIEELHMEASRGINSSQIADLATGGYLRQGEAVLITGATGCGKSFLASALGHQACAQGMKVLYFNTQKLLIQTKMARLDGSYLKFFEKMAKTQLLIQSGLTNNPVEKGFLFFLNVILHEIGHSPALFFLALLITKRIDNLLSFITS